MITNRLLWFCILFISSVFILRTVQCETKKPLDLAINQYLDDYLRIYPDRRLDAKALVPGLIEICKEQRIDPWILVVSISDESSWRPHVIGDSRGELGLTQLHGQAAKGQDLSTSLGQIRGGARWFRKGLDACKQSELQAINFYMSKNGCRPLIGAAVRRHKRIQMVKNRYCPNGCI